MPKTLIRSNRRAAVAAARPLARADEGIVVGIVAVTGHEDSVQDIIVPGAFAKTLRDRLPKLCWMHDWKLPLGRVLSIVELRPGDKRLPTRLPNGKAWPKEAGAVVATMQFNLQTQQGREFFEHAKAWAINGEAAFSIGYKVIEGMASKRGDGVRLIYGLELFEVSLVLHGAHPYALALEVKSADSPAGIEHSQPMSAGVEVKEAAAAVLEAKSLPKSQKCEFCKEQATQRVVHSEGMAYVPCCDGHLADAKDAAALSTPSGTRDTSNIDAVRPIEGKAGVPGVADTPSDHAAVQRLRDSWAHGTMAAKIGWGTGGDFDRCVTLATEHMGPEDAKGWCNLRHHDALGIYPATHAKLEGKAAAAAVVEAKSLTVETERKSMPRIRGSYEERRSLLNDALESLLIPKNEKGDRDSYLCLDATFDDHVICTVTGYGTESGQSWKVPYAVSAEGVELGKATEVELNVVVEQEPEKAVEKGEAVRMRFIDPATSLIGDAARFIHSSPASEGKSNVSEQIEGAVLDLMDALVVKGYNVAGAVAGGADEMWDEDEAMPSEHDRYTGQRKGMDEDADPTDSDDVADEDEEDWDDEQVDSELEGKGYEGWDDDRAEDDGDDVEPDGDEDDAETKDDEPDDDMVTLDPSAIEAEMKDLRG